MFLVRDKNWFVAPDDWTWDEAEDYLAYETSSRDQLKSLARLLNDLETIVFNLTYTIVEIKEELNERNSQD
jgi:hypothetical protein